jgi:toxin ParE1/3/4
MTHPLFSPTAQNDIEEIYEFTVDDWGMAQAESYIKQLQDMSNDLVKATKQGQEVDSIRQGYLRFPVGSLFIFYKQLSSEIEVIRILHKRMNFEQHFL